MRVENFFKQTSSSSTFLFFAMQKCLKTCNNLWWKWIEIKMRWWRRNVCVVECFDAINIFPNANWKGWEKMLHDCKIRFSSSPAIFHRREIFLNSKNHPYLMFILYTSIVFIFLFFWTGTTHNNIQYLIIQMR